VASDAALRVDSVPVSFELRSSKAAWIPLPRGGMKLLPFASTRDPSSAYRSAYFEQFRLDRLTRWQNLFVSLSVITESRSTHSFIVLQYSA